MYIHSSKFFSLLFIIGYWVEFLVLYSRTLLFIHSIYSSLCLLTPNFQSIPPPPHSPLATTSLQSMLTLNVMFGSIPRDGKRVNLCLSRGRLSQAEGTEGTRACLRRPQGGSRWRARESAKHRYESRETQATVKTGSSPEWDWEWLD